MSVISEWIFFYQKEEESEILYTSREEIPLLGSHKKNLVEEN